MEREIVCMHSVHTMTDLISEKIASHLMAPELGFNLMSMIRCIKRGCMHAVTDLISEKIAPLAEDPCNASAPLFAPPKLAGFR